MYYQFYRYQSINGTPRLDINEAKELISTVKAKPSINDGDINFEREIVVSRVDDGSVTYDNEVYPHAGSQFTSISTLSEASKKKISFIFTVSSIKQTTATSSYYKDITFTINAFLNKMKATNAILSSTTLGTKAVAFSSHKVKWTKGNAPYVATLEVDFIDLSGLWRGVDETISQSTQFVSPYKFRGYTFKYSFTAEISNPLNFDYWFANVKVTPLNMDADNFFLVLCPYSETAKQCIVIQKDKIAKESVITVNNEYKMIGLGRISDLSLLNTNSSFFKCSYSEHGTTKLFVACSHKIYPYPSSIYQAKILSEPVISITIRGVGYHVI